MSSLSSALSSSSPGLRSGTVTVEGAGKMSGSNGTTTSSASSSTAANVTPNLSADELAEYLKMLELLGFYPDKILINTLTMIAEDYATDVTSSKKIYNAIRHMLISSKVVAGRKLPLVYVMDSLLKNAKGQYIKWMEDESHFSVTEAISGNNNSNHPQSKQQQQCWVNVVYDQLTQSNREEERQKLRRVLNTWKQFHIFVNDPTVVDRLLSVFLQADKVWREKTLQANQMLKVSPEVKQQMERLLDEMHEGIDELDKVSLERLALVNPDLLKTIRQTAEQTLAEGGGDSGADMIGSTQSINYDNAGPSPSRTSPVENLFGETRSEDEIALSEEWAALKFDAPGKKGTQSMVDELQHFLMEQTSPHNMDQTNSSIVSNELAADNIDVNGWVNFLVCTSVCATQLTDMLQSVHDKEHTKGSSSSSSIQRGSGIWNTLMGGSTSNLLDTKRFVNKDDFTTDGIKKLVDRIIGSLYTEGMPFVSTSDGRRFKSQKEHSDHLDEIFRINQNLKMMTGKEQRAWFPTSDEWCGNEAPASAVANGQTEANTSTSSAANQVLDAAKAEKSTHAADETRSKCRICGINFIMDFDKDEGDYIYLNCREMMVSPSQEQVLVHATCLNNVGSPATLTSEQILYD